MGCQEGDVPFSEGPAAERGEEDVYKKTDQQGSKDRIAVSIARCELVGVGGRFDKGAGDDEEGRGGNQNNSEADAP